MGSGEPGMPLATARSSVPGSCGSVLVEGSSQGAVELPHRLFHLSAGTEVEHHHVSVRAGAVTGSSLEQGHHVPLDS